ncbi:acylphosphatase [bacterium]|nr:acylphosphatase [bacterium]
MISRKLTISGKVQGVYYRASAVQKAKMLGLEGYVKNEEDGSVSLGMKGEEAAVKEMTSWCKKGPALARVKEVKIEENPEIQANGFDVIH